MNLEAIKVGYDYWQDNFSKPDPYRLEPMTGAVDGKVLVAQQLFRGRDLHVRGM